MIDAKPWMNWQNKLRLRAWVIQTANYTVVFDACVLYPAPLRDLLIELAAARLFRAKWTERIHDEWTRNLLKNRRDLTPEKLTRTRQLMNAAVLDCIVIDFEALSSGLDLPDEDDKHVLAAAIKCGASAIITANGKDFPAKELGKYGIEAQHPDEFLVHQIGLDPAAVISAARACRTRLRKPPVGAPEYLETLQALSLPQTVAELSLYATVI